MKKYDIWMEGYKCMNESSSAQLITTNVEGNSFIEAIENWQKSLNNKSGLKNELYIDKERNYAAIWGCRLYDNEIDARKNFG